MISGEKEMTGAKPMRRTFLVRTAGVIALAIVLDLSLAACSTPEPALPKSIPTGDFEYADRYLDWIVRRNMAKADIPGCAVTVVARDRVLFQRAYGVIGRNTPTPVTTRTFFRAGSITKSLTALTIMKLKAEGKIDLDAPLTAYLPEFSIKSRFQGAAPITVRMLLAHRSGITGDYLAGIMGERRLSPVELVAALKNEYLCFPPGEVFYYSNTGYGLLGAVIERVTGRRYAEYVKTEIMNPLGMKESALELTPAIAPLMARGHMPASLGFFPGGEKGAAEAPYLPLRDAAAGALITNIEELGKYTQCFLDDHFNARLPVVGKADFFQMVQPQFWKNNAQVFEAVDYGLGFMLDTFTYEDVTDCIHHSGNVNGYYSFFVFSPSRGIGLALLTNSASGLFSCYELVSRAFRKYLDAATPEANRAEAPAGTPEYRPPASPVPPAPIDVLAGRYSMLGLTIGVEKRGDSLMLVFPPAKLDLALTRVSGNRFSVAAMILGILPVDPAPFLSLDEAAVNFDLTTTGAATLTLEGTAGEAVIRLAFRKISAPENSATFDPNRLGTYTLVREDRTREALDLYLPIKTLKLEMVYGKYVVLSSPELGPDLKLYMAPVSADEALLLGTNETVFFHGDELVFSGLRAKKK
jgi:CubicO group peptidase (beta-lactamase class C family)